MMSAEIPNIRPDVLIVESTYGYISTKTQIFFEGNFKYFCRQRTHDKREDREKRFTGTVSDIVTRGGRCLIPVFALGRAQDSVAKNRI